jgi:predicted DsbA family dithiol-disulfide isomerase
MTLPTIEIYSSIECPFAYLAIYRLRQLWPDYAGRVQIVWRALSLEYINQRGTPKPTISAEIDFLKEQVEPGLPVQVWSRPEWQWPVTFWPAFEALACAQAQSHDAAFALSWSLRQAFFGQSRSPALRHELLAIAQGVAAGVDLDLARLAADWDAGRYKATVIHESQRGWHELKVNGSATFILPDGRQFTNPAIGEVDFDEENNVLRHYTPYEGNPLDAFRQMLETATLP